MNFATDLMADLMSRPAPEDAAKGLELVEEQVTNVIDAIEKELQSLKPKRFETDGEIQPASFGDTDRSSVLALHHRRAHAVTYETLEGVRVDLETFRSACAEARSLVQTADDNAAVEAALTRRAVDRLLEGSASDHGAAANAEAQQNASGSEPTGDTGGTGADSGGGTGSIGVDDGTDGTEEETA